MEREWRRRDHVISTDRDRLDVALIHDFLSTRSYWALGIPRAVVERSLEHSLAFGLYSPVGQVGFGRVVTDYATFAWLGDVFVLEPARGRGLGTWLVGTIVELPELASLRRWMLATNDAHGLYRKFGFVDSPPARLMEKVDPDVYCPTRSAGCVTVPLMEDSVRDGRQIAPRRR